MEQQLVRGSTIVPKDNLVIGPSEYDVKIPQRHISTPVLGKHGGHFSPFKSKLSVRTPNGGSSRPFSRGSSPPKSASYPKRNSLDNREFNTVYHSHDERQPFDPKSNVTPTPGPYLGQNEMLKKIDQDGTHATKKTVHYDSKYVPFGERNLTKKALPEYDVQHDSLQVRPTPKLTSFSTDKRIYIPLGEATKKGKKKGKKKKKAAVGNLGDTSSQEEGDEGNERPNEYEGEQGHGAVRHAGHSYYGIQQGSNLSSISPGGAYSPRRQQRSPQGSVPRGMAFNQGKLLEGVSLFQLRCSSVPLPRLKYRSPPMLSFDASSYRSAGSKPLDLTPKIVQREARLNLFDKYYVIPRQHKSTQLGKKPSTDGY